MNKTNFDNNENEDNHFQPLILLSPDNNYDNLNLDLKNDTDFGIVNEHTNDSITASTDQINNQLHLNTNDKNSDNRSKSNHNLNDNVSNLSKFISDGNVKNKNDDHNHGMNKEINFETDNIPVSFCEWKSSSNKIISVIDDVDWNIIKSIISNPDNHEKICKKKQIHLN